MISDRNTGIGQICIGGGITGSERTRQPQNRLGNVERFTGSKLIVTLAVTDDEPEVRTGFLSFDCPVPDAVIGIGIAVGIRPPSLCNGSCKEFGILTVSQTDYITGSVLRTESALLAVIARDRAGSQ